MGFASLLSEISSGKTPKGIPTSSNPTQRMRKPNSVVVAPKKPSSSLSAKSPQFPSSNGDDPAVRRLKEARRKERELREAQSPASKKRSLTSKRASTTTSSNPRSKSQLIQKKQPQPQAPPNPQRNITTGPKLSFKQLMKHADTIDTSKLALVSIKKPSLSDSKPKPSKSLQSIKRAEKIQLSRASPPTRSRVDEKLPVKKPNVPRFAKPSPELLKRIEAKKKLQKHHNMQQTGRKPINKFKPEKKVKDSFGIDAEEDSDEESYGYGNNDYYNDDDESFIVDDYDNQYSKGEIWNMFNNKKAYNDRYDDYDMEDDMEATGAEIFEEEELALKQAKLDDKREQLLLEKRAAEKKKRLGRM